MTSILAIEDDPTIRAALERGLEERGHTVQTAATGVTGIEAVLGDRPDLVLLDLGLPDVDGLTVIGMIRAASSVPIIVLTAIDDDPTMVKVLDAGADDYIVKPFRLDQVTARIRAVLRRSGGRPSTEPIRVGELLIHEPTRTVTLAGEELILARREFDLLLALARRAGEVISKRTLLSEVWQQDGGSERTVDVHLSWVRRKLGETAAEPRYIESVRGVGVRLVDPEARRDRLSS
jgi:DNA-binding response OmpR family regulator